MFSFCRYHAKLAQALCLPVPLPSLDAFFSYAAFLGGGHKVKPWGVFTLAHFLSVLAWLSPAATRVACAGSGCCLAGGGEKITG